MYLPATDEQRDYAENVYTLLSNGAVAVVPGLWAIEVGAVLIHAKRRRKINAERLALALHDLSKLPTNITHKHYTPMDVVSIAAGYMLQGYDAVYFDTAKRLGVPLATLDRGQKSACGHHGVKLLTF